MLARKSAFRPQVEALEAREVPAFGTGGVVIADLPADMGTGPSTALQADGKIVVAAGNKVARFNIDGSLDTTFSGTGIRTITGIPGNGGAIFDVAVTADGGIVVGGSVGVANGSDFYVERLLPDGTPDTTFDGDGVVVKGFKKGAGEQDRIYDIALQGDGKIVAVGEVNGLGQWGVARFNVNGTLDTSFSGDGWLTDAFDKQTRDEFATAVTVQPDGKILVQGTAHRAATGRDIVVVRYNANGTLDSSFGTSGKAWIDFGPEVGAASTVERRIWSGEVVLGSSGTIVVASETSQYGLGVARLTASGTLDTSFSGNGLLLVLPPGWSNIADSSSIVVQSDGGLLVTANHDSGNVGSALVRYTAGGTLDTSFDGDGYSTFTYSAGNGNQSADTVIQSDGKIVVVGRTFLDDQFQLGVARFNADGSFDV